MYRLILIIFICQNGYSAAWVDRSERELAYRKVPKNAAFKILDTEGTVLYRGVESLHWKKIDRKTQLYEGDLVFIHERSSILLQINRSATAATDRDQQKVAQLLYDQEGIVRLDTSLRREVKVLGNVVQSVSASKQSQSSSRQKSIMSFQSAWSKARVISFDATIRSNEMNLGRLGDSQQTKGVAEKIKILNPSPDGNIEYRKLPKEMLITWKPTSQFTDKDRKYAVFIWKSEQKPSAPVAITDQTFYTYEITEPGRFKLKIVDLETGAMSDANLNFQVFQRGTTLKGKGSGIERETELPKRLPRLFGVFPKEASTLVGKEFCSRVNFLWEADEQETPYYRFYLRSESGNELESLQKKLSSSPVKERKPGVRISSRKSSRVTIKDDRKVYTNQEVVSLDLNPGSYTWKVSLLDSTTKEIIKESREYKVVCRELTYKGDIVKATLGNHQDYNENQSIFFMQ